MLGRGLGSGGRSSRAFSPKVSRKVSVVLYKMGLLLFFCSPYFSYQIPLYKAGKGPLRAHTPDLIDLAAGNRLSVGNDRKHLKSRWGKFAWGLVMFCQSGPSSGFVQRR